MGLAAAGFGAAGAGALQMRAGAARWCVLQELHGTGASQPCRWPQNGHHEGSEVLVLLVTLVLFFNEPFVTGNSGT